MKRIVPRAVLGATFVAVVPAIAVVACGTSPHGVAATCFDNPQQCPDVMGDRGFAVADAAFGVADAAFQMDVEAEAGDAPNDAADVREGG